MKNIFFILIFVSTFCLGQAGRPTASNPVFPVTTGTANLKLYGNVNYKPFTLTGNVTITHNVTNNVACVTKITATPQLGYKIIFPVGWNRISYASFDTAQTNVIYINRNANGIVDYSISVISELNKNRSLSNYNLTLSPTDSLVSKTQPTNINFVGSPARTVVFWLKITNTTGGNNCSIIECAGQWRFSTLSNQMKFKTNIKQSISVQSSASGDQPAYETWFMIQLFFYTNSYLAIKYNNDLLPSTYTDFVPGGYPGMAAFVSSDRLVISENSKSFKIDNLAFFNRNLTAGEVTELYNGGRQLDYSTTSVAANILEYFTFDNTLFSKQSLELEGRNGKKIIYSKDTPLK